MPNEALNQAIDFRTYYDLETYLFETVSPRFAEEHSLTAFDFFCIVIWKANRAKSKIARRLVEAAAIAPVSARTAASRSG
jgi:hypothetical protein